MSDSVDDSGIKNVYTLGFVSLFTDISSEMVFSLLPVYILGLPGSSRAILGFVEGVAEALGYSLRAISGYVSDRFRKRKAIIMAGYALSNFIKPFFAMANRIMDVFVIRIMDRVGKGLRTAPRDAILSESVPEGKRGVAFGIHRTLDQIGAILGPLLASATMLVLGLTIRDVFWISFIPGLIALLILILFVEERIRRTDGELHLLKGWRGVLTRDFSRLLFVVALFSLGAFNFSFILLNARESGVIDPLIPIIYAVLNVTHTVIGIPAGMLSDKIGKEKVLIFGFSTFFATILLMMFSPKSLLFAYIIAAFFGFFIGIVETVQRALIPDYTESGLRGTAYGIYYLVVGVSFFISNTIVGTLWEIYGSDIAALYSGSLTIIAIAAMLTLLGRMKKI